MSAPSVEADLFRLLHHRRLRATWRTDRAVLAPELASLDADEVERAARQVIRAVRTRRWRGTGGLVEAFPRSIASWRATRDDPDLVELIGGFLDSDLGDDWHEHDPGSRCFEDLFSAWWSSTATVDTDELAHERLAAIGRALVVAPDAFRPPHEFIAIDGGWRAEHGGIAVVASHGRYVRGPTVDVDRWLRRGQDLSIAN
jgi:hypothetical protein